MSTTTPRPGATSPRRRVQQALTVLSLGHLSVEAVAATLSDGWKLPLRIEATS